ncbi:MAG: gliding motility-associated C-terminal domain-containing protein, partial [Bacteroidia bacterium]|nr:gliding motility-associated C-terminal domain-containing protein [Bacteroidia bacterium]
VLHDFSSDGFFQVKRKVRGDRGCWDSVTRQVQVYPLPANGFTHIDTCFTDITQLASTSTSTLGMPLTHVWTLDGTNYYGPNPAHTFSSVGTQTIRLETENTLGCRDTLVQNIEIEPLPNVNFSFDNICERQEAFFYDNSTTKGSVTNWKWDVKNRTVSFLEDHSQVFNVAGNYPVKLTTSNNFGCIDSFEQQITVWPKALARFNVYPKEIFITEPYVNLVQDGANANSWEWRFGDLSDDENGPEVFHEYPDTGLFNVRLIANNDNGCADTFYRNILIKPDLRIFIPNAFSPGGGNDVNTVFRPGGTLHGLKKMEMSIYTRWGELIFHSEDINNPWDGMYQGKLVQNGTYLYVLKVKDIYNDVFHFSGTVTVVK